MTGDFLGEAGVLTTFDGEVTVISFSTCTPLTGDDRLFTTCISDFLGERVVTVADFGDCWFLRQATSTRELSLGANVTDLVVVEVVEALDGAIVVLLELLALVPVVD